LILGFTTISEKTSLGWCSRGECDSCCCCEGGEGELTASEGRGGERVLGSSGYSGEATSG